MKQATEATTKITAEDVNVMLAHGRLEAAKDSGFSTLASTWLNSSSS
jgi:hypothetical protein